MVRALREDGYEIVWVKETHIGMDDEDIIALARQKNEFITINKNKIRRRVI